MLDEQKRLIFCSSKNIKNLTIQNLLTGSVCLENFLKGSKKQFQDVWVVNNEGCAPYQRFAGIRRHLFLKELTSWRDLSNSKFAQPCSIMTFAWFAARHSWISSWVWMQQFRYINVNASLDTVEPSTKNHPEQNTASLDSTAQNKQTKFQFHKRKEPDAFWLP